MSGDLGDDASERMGDKRSGEWCGECSWAQFTVAISNISR